MTNKYWWQRPGYIEVINNQIHFAGKNIETIAREFGTPLYIYNLDAVFENYQTTKNMLSGYANGRLQTKVYYAMKANGADEVLDILKTADASIDTSSIGEVKKALEIGYKPENIIFTGTNFGLDGFEFLANSGILINVDSFSQLNRLMPYAPLNISIRLNPNISGVGFNRKFEMSGSDLKASRLGIEKGRIIEAFLLAREHGLNPVCLHQHVGSNWFRHDNFEAYMKGVETALDVIKQLEELNFNIKTLNLGGGLGVRSHEMYPAFPLELFTKSIVDAVLESNTGIECLAIEPGRYIVGNAAVLISTVNMVERKNNVNYVGIDVGFNAFHHKFLYNIENTIVNVSKIDQPLAEDYAIAGNLGEQGDIFSEKERLPITEENDIIMLYPAGAYCASELAQHHFLPVPKELFLKKKKNCSDLSLMNYCKVCSKNCCYIGPVNVTTQEYDLIVETTSKKEAFKVADLGVLQINNVVGQPCHFLASDGCTCSIHDIKPAECKAYPLLIGKNGEIENGYAAAHCPASQFVEASFFRQARKALGEIPPELRDKFYEINIKLGHN